MSIDGGHDVYTNFYQNTNCALLYTECYLQFSHMHNMLYTNMKYIICSCK